MSNYLLKPVFKSVFNRDFQQNVFEDRLEMQKAVYLLQSMGISVGNYNFLWYKHGPYSQTLQNDILSIQSVGDVDVEFSNDAKREINALKNAIHKENIQYNLCQWVECLGSLQYIKESLLPSSSDENDILAELEMQKPHLNITEDNRLALQTLKELSI